MDPWLVHILTCQIPIDAQAVGNNYITENYTCTICDINGIYARDPHKNDNAHRQKTQRANNSLSDYLLRSREVYRIVDDCRGLVTAVSLHEPMLPYLFQLTGPGGRARTKHGLDSVVTRAKWDAGVITLELCLWKTACLLNPPDESIQRDMTKVLHWTKSGWKSNKSA